MTVVEGDKMAWKERWQVTGTSGHTYTVAKTDSGQFGCDCPAWKFQKKIDGKRRDCQHILQLRMKMLENTQEKKPSASVTSQENLIRKVKFED